MLLLIWSFSTARGVLSAALIGEITFAIPLRHIPNFSFRCDVNGCTKTTSNYSTLMSHLSRQHGDVDVESPTVHSLVTSFPQDEDTCNMMDLDFGNGSTLLLACVSSTNIEEYGFERILERFISDINELSEVGVDCE